MNKQFKAVSMDCTQEQFEMLKPYLKKIEVISVGRIGDFKGLTLLTNNLGGINGVISNIARENKKHHNRTYIGPFNLQAFMEACGYESEPSMKGKWFKYINVVTPCFTFGKWYQCCKDSPLEPFAFIDNLGNEYGYEKNDVYFDLSNPMPYNPDMVTMTEVKKVLIPLASNPKYTFAQVGLTEPAEITEQIQYGFGFRKGVDL